MRCPSTAAVVLKKSNVVDENRTFQSRRTEDYFLICIKGTGRCIV
jgi:hypothetical protein